MNSIHIIYPKKKRGVWSFTDKEAGLRKEPFVGDANELIDELVKFYGIKLGRKKKLTLLFSAVPFPDATKLDISDWHHGDPGVSYTWNGIEAWLCPAFYCYFDISEKPPKSLYVMAA